MGRTARLDTISGSKQLLLISLSYDAAAAPRGSGTSLICDLAAAAPRGSGTSLICDLAAAANKQSNGSIQLQLNSTALYLYIHYCPISIYTVLLYIYIYSIVSYLYINSTAELQYVSATVHQHYSTSVLYKNPKGALQGAPKSGAVCVTRSPIETTPLPVFRPLKTACQNVSGPFKNSQAASARRFLDKNSHLAALQQSREKPVGRNSSVLL
jgi:hypothetical protein